MVFLLSKTHVFLTSSQPSSSDVREITSQECDVAVDKVRRPARSTMHSERHSRLTFVSLAVCVIYALALLDVESTTASETVQKRCASCSMTTFEEYKDFRQKQILAELLKKLELPAKPNVTSIREGRENAHRRVRKSTRSMRQSDYGSDEDMEREYYPALYEVDPDVSPQTSYIIAEEAPSWYNQEGEIAVFNFSPNLHKKYVNKAVLNVFLRRPEEYRFLRIPIRVEVYERFPNGTLGEKVASKHDNIQADHFETQVAVHLDELDVQRWLQRGNTVSGGSSIGLYVQAIHDNENLVYYPGDGFRDVMFLELELYDNGGRQRRSNPHVCRQGANNNQSSCCLYDLVIDFEKVGWEFVIAPKRYNAYICNGECSAMQIGGSARGSIAQAAHLDYYQCCHPKEYAGITVVYVTEKNEIWVKEVPGMVAKKCGCA
ncbi:transforming growth factor beta like domain-containing protein [Ditylenchus destructor]|uniref:Transforming growth factor beta like domain-containing protein n=1 Tax=Ditylenchus destructor TaxID=166010 RepID=A0AAD4NFI1_9BILA|nr:transforming growth factor beta like domain-containing protein [Ditylenchus destructor]